MSQIASRLDGRMLVALVVLIVPLTANAQDKSNVPSIKVLKDDWGGAPQENIEAVCRSVAKELMPFFPKRKLDPITIKRSKGAPMVIFGKGADGERRVMLNVGGTFWAQFAYQFGHEMGHILCNYREANNPNLWFEEAFCETASIFAMRRMGRTWKTNPPYSNWKPFAGALESYADNYIRGVAKLERETLPKWLADNEKDLRKIDRPKIHAVGVHVLLPLLEKNPSHWEALNWLNQFDAKKELTFADYLSDWHTRVPEAHKSFVANIATAFRLPIAESKK